MGYSSKETLIHTKPSGTAYRLSCISRYNPVYMRVYIFRVVVSRSLDYKSLSFLIIFERDSNDLSGITNTLSDTV